MGEIYVSCGHKWEEKKLPASLWWHSYESDSYSGNYEIAHAFGSLCRPCRSKYDLCGGPEMCIEGVYQEPYLEDIDSERKIYPLQTSLYSPVAIEANCIIPCFIHSKGHKVAEKEGFCII